MMKNRGIEIKWAIIFTAMMLLWMVVEKMSGLHDEHIDQHALYSMFVAIPAIAIYVIALLDKRKNSYNGRMTYQQGFITGFIITFFVTILPPLTQYITSTVISPDYFTNVIEYAVDNDVMTRKAAEAEFNLNNYLIMATVGSFVMGTVTSLIVAIFTRK